MSPPNESGPSVQERADKCEANVPVPFNFIRDFNNWCWKPDVQAEIAKRKADIQAKKEDPNNWMKNLKDWLIRQR